MLPSELTDYVSSPDPAFQWQKDSKNGRVTTWRMVSQLWQGLEWSHAIVMVEPERRVARGICILYITGGEPNPLDLDEAYRLSELSGLPVAHLFHIPRQPIADLWEDDLVAFTFLQYLETGDRTWPLLLPMTKAAVRAMDVLQGATERSANPLNRFVVTGASKRGWTTWLSACVGDERVVGIAPMVYDNLNLPAQLRHQHENWTTYSEMISPYTALGLHERLGSPEGQRLAAVVDPYTYRERLELPKLIVNGSNDPYWSVDSTSLYWEGLPATKWTSVVPNAGHGLGDKGQALAAIGAFARSCAGRLSMPEFRWDYRPDALELEFSPPFPEVVLWVAEADNLDFRPSRWEVRAESGAGRLKADRAGIRLLIPQSARNQAVMAALRYQVKDLAFSLSTPVRVYAPK